jgi:hypothetical protein
MMWRAFMGQNRILLTNVNRDLLHWIERHLDMLFGGKKIRVHFFVCARINSAQMLLNAKIQFRFLVPYCCGHALWGRMFPRRSGWPCITSPMAPGGPAGHVRTHTHTHTHLEPCQTTLWNHRDASGMEKKEPEIPCTTSPLLRVSFPPV